MWQYICVMIKYMIHLIDRSCLFTTLHWPQYCIFFKNLLTANNFHRQACACISVGKRKVGHTRDLHFWNQLQMHCPKSMTVPANQVQKGKDYSNFFLNITLRNHINCFKHSYPYSQQNYICIYSKRLSEINTFKLSKYEYAFKKIYLACRINDNFIFSLYVDH